MAGDKVKKGFSFYLMMLILILVAAFFVVVTIMIFSPGKDVLGYKYFYYNDTHTFVETSDEAQNPINFRTITEIDVECGSATVNVVKGAVEQDTISIKNVAIGFAKASDNTDFQKSVVLDGTTLKIRVKEPEGFLHFSNEIVINIIVPESAPEGQEEVAQYQLQNTALKITTTKGDVNIGLSSSSKEELDSTNTVSPSRVNIQTDSGTIKFNKYCASTFNELSLSTKSGKIESDIALRINAEEAYIGTETGDINVSKLYFVDGLGSEDYTKILNIQNTKGNVKINELGGTASIITESGKFDFGTIKGHFSANNTRDKIDAPTINIKKVEQDVSIPYGKGASISIGEADGQINIATISGNVKVGYDKEISGTSWISTESGSIEAYIADKTETRESHNFSSATGAITVYYNQEINSENSIISSSGNITFNIRSTYKILLEVKNSAGNYIESISDTVSFEFIDSNEYEMPFRLNGYTGNDDTVLLQTDGTIRGNLIAIE